MTDEAQGYNSEDAPARPASTRWSEAPVQDDDELAPPYVPGRRSHAAASNSTTSSDSQFPFDPFDNDDEAGSAGHEAVVEGEAPTAGDAGVAGEAGVADDFGSQADELVWSPEDLDDGGERSGDDEREHDEGSYAREPSGEESFGSESYGEWSPDYEDDDTSAVDAELEPVTEEAPVEEAEATEPEPPPPFEPDGSIEMESPYEPDAYEPDAYEPDPYAGAAQQEPADERVEEAAAILDRLAGLLRDEGEEAVRREMKSPDRLTALVSSLLSGHLSARQ